GKLEKFTKTVDLKGFYKELHDFLVDNDFKDIMGEKKNIAVGDFIEGWTKAGEFTENNANENRTGDIFETKYSWSNLGSVVDFELIWECILKSKITQYGWYYFKLDLVCRNLKDVEVLEGNTKKIMQSGGWEFRNHIIYRNSIERNYLNKIPFIQNSPKLKNMYRHYIYEKILDDDVHYGVNVVHGNIYKLLKKYFA
ncbi:MAG: hypothetical protein KC589_09560, partial [Nanoarchaeota archaeon]|nr:hypothetical protein [Nanoarchaeota archaeon]